MQETPRLLFVHAHPDDETINNGVTMAHYAALGAEVVVVTCTLGEEGEVIDDRWTRLAVDEADQLGGYRIAELTVALRSLGLGQPRFLGGAGRWRDSGMVGTPPRRHTRFVDADFDEAVAELVAVITELRPHVVVTYDPEGGYGHPDHIHAHRVTTAAVATAAPSWQVLKFYWTVISANAFRAGLDSIADADVLPDWIRLTGDATVGPADDHITTVVEAPDRLPAKADAIAAHATQILLGPTRRAFALSNRIVLPVLSAEHYVLVQGELGPTDERGWETDLLAGLK
jgi:N-acetyl-1-D-myo-inositol-2-amino-2-deoxy-alpha-D-glucopyranoside deacetylase